MRKPRIYVQGGGHKAVYLSGFLTALAANEGLEMSHFEEGKGCSSGGIALAMFHSGAGRERVYKNWFEDHAYGEIIHPHRILMGKHPWSTEELDARVKRNFSHDDFDDSKPKIHMSVTNLDGENEYIQATRQNIFEILHATTAIPLLIGRKPIHPPEAAEAKYVFDGGVSAITPKEEIEACKHDINQKLVIVNCKSEEEQIKGFSLFDLMVIFNKKLRKAYKKSKNDYRKYLKLARDLPNVHIVEPPSPINGKLVVSPDRVAEIFEKGEATAQGEQGDRLMEFLV